MSIPLFANGWYGKLPVDEVRKEIQAIYAQLSPAVEIPDVDLTAYYTSAEVDALLAGKSAVGHTHAWADIVSGVPSTFPPSAHTHVRADITDFAHTHGTSDITNLSSYTGLDSRYYTESEVDSLLAGKSDTSHNHTFNSLSNVTITSVAAGELVTWSGSAWINETLAEAGIAASARNITAGNGLTGGGNLTADRTITMGTPGTLSGTTTNSVSATSHTHALDASVRSTATYTSGSNSVAGKGTYTIPEGIWYLSCTTTAVGMYPQVNEGGTWRMLVDLNLSGMGVNDWKGPIISDGSNVRVYNDGGSAVTLQRRGWAV